MIAALKRPSARLRLTALFGTLFLVAGALLLSLTYVLVRQTLPQPGDGIAFIQKGTTGDLFTSPLSSVGTAPATATQLVGQAQQQVLSTLLLESGVALVLMAMISVLVGWIVAGRVLAPVHQITATARRLSQANLHERIALTGPDDEIKELADTFDAMLARLDAAFESQQRFVANASHELRTPLATQRALVDVNLADPNASPAQLRATLEKIGTVTDESERLIASLLTLAKSQRGIARRAPVDLADLMRTLLSEMSPNGGGPLEMRLDLGSVELTGDRALLRRMVGNLLDNARRYNLPGGWIAVRTGTENGAAVLEVSNSGEKIPAAATGSLFEPFRRLDHDRVNDHGGVGLGLSIVQAIAVAHGGDATAQALEEGGLAVSVRMPLSSAPGSWKINRREPH